MSDLIKPMPAELVCADGVTRTFLLSKVPAVQGREIALQYPTSGMPKVGDYALNQKLMLRLISYVAVVTSEGTELRLTTEALINNHVPEWEDLVKLEGLMISYNFSFFNNGKGLNFLDGLIQNIKSSGIEMLTRSLGQLLPQDKQP